MTVVAAEAEWDAQISINAIADVVICFWQTKEVGWFSYQRYPNQKSTAQMRCSFEMYCRNNGWYSHKS